MPPEFRTWGAPPGIEIVDPMMRHLSVDYYVGWLAAASLFGVAHQAPQVFQVATSRDVRNHGVGRTRFEFRTRARLPSVPTLTWRTREGSALVSTLEATLLDVATNIGAVGGLDNAATVIVELAEHEDFDTDALVEIAREHPAASSRRAGWILETYGGQGSLDALARGAASTARTPSRLDPSASESGAIDERWNLRLNTELEPDL